MNKLLIISLAICLVSVHAFVKRDAPPAEDSLKKIQDQIEALGKQIGDKISETFNPEQVQKGLNDLMDSINKAIGPKTEAPKQ